jgi:hypothetical protein
MTLDKSAGRGGHRGSTTGAGQDRVAKAAGQRREFMCVLETADGSGAGSAALALSRGRLWFSVELNEPHVIRTAAIVAEDARKPVRVELFVRSETVAKASLVGWVALPELDDLGADLFQGRSFRLELVSDALLMGGPLLEIIARQRAAEGPNGPQTSEGDD